MQTKWLKSKKTTHSFDLISPLANDQLELSNFANFIGVINDGVDTMIDNYKK